MEDNVLAALVFPTDESTAGRRSAAGRTPAPQRKETDMPITPCLWFDTDGEQAAQLYTSVFPNSSIGAIGRYGPAGPRAEGSAVSFQISGGSQEEVDHYWDALSAGGQEGPCGWLKDRFGLSWQVVPTRLGQLLSDPDPERAADAS